MKSTFTICTQIIIIITISPQLCVDQGIIWRACCSNVCLHVLFCACMGDTPVWKVLCDRSKQRQWGRGPTDKWEANAFRSILSWERVSGVEKGEWKVVSREGGAAEGLINHSCIAIDFLLKGVSQTLNYVSVLVCMCVCVCTVLIENTQSHQLQVQTSLRFGTVAGLVVH